MNQRSRYKYVLPVTALLALFFIAGCTNSNDRQSDARTGVEELHMQGRQMPSFHLPSPLPEDTAISNGSLEGKVLLVSFFASWCRSCLEQIRFFTRLSYPLILRSIQTGKEQVYINFPNRHKHLFTALLIKEYFMEQ